jgi:hypothetical protein
MKNSRPFTFNQVVVGMLAVIAVLMTSFISFTYLRNDRVAVAKIPISGVVAPKWSDSKESLTAFPEMPPRIDILVDHSQPMGGYLSTAPTQVSTLQAMLTIAKDELAQSLGGADLRIAQFSMTESIEVVEDFQWETENFLGEESRLDLGISELTARLHSGETQTALIATDLVGTGTLVGGTGVGLALENLLNTPEVKHGQLHIGLFGARLPYWGVVARLGPSACQKKRGNLGCWLSEQGKQWLPLEQVVARPLYFLVFARELHGLESMASGLQNYLKKKDIDAAWLVLTDIPRKELLEGNCEFDLSKALAVYSDRHIQCNRRERISFYCELSPKPNVLPTQFQSSWPELDIQIAATNKKNGSALQLHMEFDCNQHPSTNSATPLEISFSMKPGARNTPFASWSTATDFDAADLNKTLGLDHFLTKAMLVPAYYQFSASSVLFGDK